MADKEGVGVPQLGSDDQDTKTALLKAALGSVPVAGPVLAELVGFIIPRQRQDRFEQYLLLLAERLASVEEHVVQKIAESERAADLFEEGAIQSARAISNERKAYITALVANGLSGDQQEQIDAKRLLKLLGEIDDDQVILLCKYLDRYSEDEEWVEKHEALIYGDPPSEDDDEATELRHWMRQLAIDQIERLGLIKRKNVTRSGARAPGYELTWLGRSLLNRIGLAEMDEH
ncbi:hypothetical protein [Bosea rubneri]|uniref:Uncharacterized protein n=1 Tax=Bosea rubneri TaxID=3075434 RepID=A0ABU3SH23_9HYPH|nr:hypothetical protein [Bosea sp. ZW T0_25]MDU0343961.1 hypothetical protein [Bosea sp. ZW T0_25]